MPSEAGRAQGAVSSASRLENALRAKDDLKLVAYMMAGHPNKRRSIEVGKRLAGSGIAALEIGIPHYDPLADGPVIQHAGQVALETIFMVAPTTPPDRITSICSHSSGFVYCVTVTGITGARKELPQGMPELLREVRKRTQLPVAAGFGISRPEHMKSLRGGAD